MDYLQIGSSWLHLVATVVLLGYVGVLGLVVIPVLRRDLELPKACELVVAFERRAMPGVVLALVAFLATGVYLTVSDGLISRKIAVTLKHVLVAALLGLGLYADARYSGAGDVAS